MGQLFVCVKGTAVLIPEIANTALPLLVRFTDCAGLVVPATCEPKLRPAGESDTEGCGENPVPLRLTLSVFGVDPSVPATVSAPIRVPTAFGVKVTLNVHEVPPCTPDAEQLLTCEKSPVICVLENRKQVDPLFVKVTGCGALDVPIA